MTRNSELLETLITRLQEKPDVRAVWLAGSRGRGTDDEYSDIDIWIAVDDVFISSVVADPLAFVHGFMPTIMHMVVSAIAPAGGAFVGSWVPVDDAFVQVDWYIAPASSASREADTQLVYGDVPVTPLVDLVRMPDELATGKIRDNLMLALIMVNNLVKYARRGHTWRAVDHARHADRCLANADWLLNHGTEPGYETGKTTFLPEPVCSDASGIRTLAQVLLDKVAEFALRAEISQIGDSPVASMQAVISEWGNVTPVPTEEYYRSLPRRRLGAGVLLTDDAGRVLLLETTYKSEYEIPGGVCEQGESPRTTATREVSEEIGLDITPGRLLVFDHRCEPDPKGDAIMLIYDAGEIDAATQFEVDGIEIAAYRWVEPADLDGYVARKMAARVRAAIRARQEHRLIELDDSVATN